MRAFKGGQNAFGARERDDGIESCRVILRNVLGATRVVKGCMLGADGGVIEPGGDGVCERDLAVLILQHVGEGSLQYARCAALETGCVFAERRSTASCFHADQA